MSKASEWAKAKVEADRVSARRPAIALTYTPLSSTAGGSAYVNMRVVTADDGQVWCEILGAPLSPAEALRGARWILDTFGEAP